MFFLKKIYRKFTNWRWEIGFVDNSFTGLVNGEPLKVHWVELPFKVPPCGPIPHNMACSLMPRQPYNIAVSITTGQLFPPYTSPMPHLIYARPFEDSSFSIHRLGEPGLFLNQD